MAESRLPEIQIIINGVTYDNSFARDILIDRTMLDDEFARQPETYAYYAFLAEDAKAVFERKKFALEQVYARLDHEKRMAADAMKAQNPKFKMTEKMVENEVITDDRYTEARNDMLDAKLLAGQLDQAAKAISQRRDMLQQMGANNRVGQMPTRVMENKQEAVRDIVARSQAEQRAPEPTPAPPTRSRRKPKA
jgi:hypothetical protein